MLLKDAIEEFLLELDIRGNSKETIRGYTNCLKIFQEYIGYSATLDNIKPINIKEFAKFNKDRGLKIKTQNAYISSIRALYSYLIEEEVVSKNLGYSVKLVDANDKKEIEVFTKEEIKKLIQHKRTFNEKVSPFLVVRDNLILNFLLETGCRNHELTNLKYEDIQDGLLFFKVTKNSKPRVVPISKKLKKLMLRYERMKEEHFRKNKTQENMEDLLFP